MSYSDQAQIYYLGGWLKTAGSYSYLRYYDFDDADEADEYREQIAIEIHCPQAAYPTVNVYSPSGKLVYHDVIVESIGDRMIKAIATALSYSDLLCNVCFDADGLLDGIQSGDILANKLNRLNFKEYEKVKSQCLEEVHSRYDSYFDSSGYWNVYNDRNRRYETANYEEEVEEVDTDSHVEEPQEDKTMATSKPAATTEIAATDSLTDLLAQGAEAGFSSAVIEVGAQRLLMKMGADPKNPFAVETAKLMFAIGLRNLVIPMMGDKLPKQEFVKKRADLAVLGVSTTGAHAITLELAETFLPFIEVLGSSGIEGAKMLLGMKTQLQTDLEKYQEARKEKEKEKVTVG